MAVVPDHVEVIPDGVGAYGDAVSPTDYGCVRRYRHRRLATYLALHGFRDTLRGLLNETDAFLSAAHLSGLVQQGLWDAAIAYLSRFLRPPSQPRSDQAQVLVHFLRQLKVFASMVAGGNNRDLKFVRNKRHLKHDDPRIRSFVLPRLLSLDWQRVRHKASQIVYDLVFEAPELKDLALLPGGSMLPQHVLPIGSRSCRRRYVKEQDLPRAKALTKVFLRTKKRLPSSTRSHELNTRLTNKTWKWVLDSVDESFKAGRLELQSSGKKDVPHATVSHTTSGTSSLENAGALVAPVSQIMSGTLTVPSEISGALVAAVSQTVNLTSHAENSGISAVIDAGITKLLSLENSNLRKHPRTEDIIFDHTKMQRTSGAFCEACQTSVTNKREAGAGLHV